MISEQELSKLSYPTLPEIVTKNIPGPCSSRLLEEAIAHQTPTRPSIICNIVAEQGLGAGIRDCDGNYILDFSGGVAVSAVGRNHPKVVSAILDQTKKIMHTAGLVSPTTVQLARRMAEIMPEGLRESCFTCFGLSGSGSVETAIKFAKFITGRSQIIAFEGAYHGVFHGALAATTRESFRAGYGPFMPGVMHMPYAYCYRCFADLNYPGCGTACAKYFDSKLNTPNTGADDIAAVLIEPMQADGGYIVPPADFLPKLKESCEKNGALLIADEVQAGAGRTGKMWSIEHFGVTPDMLVWAKAIGGDQPLSGVTLNSKYYDRLRPVSQVTTSAENAIANVVAMANIELLTDKNIDLLGRATLVGNEIRAMISRAAEANKIIGDVRGKGFFFGIELVRNRNSKEPLAKQHMTEIVSKCEERGLRIMTCGRYGSVIRLMPPLITTREHLNAGIQILLDVLREIGERVGNE